MTPVKDGLVEELSTLWGCRAERFLIAPDRRGFYKFTPGALAEGTRRPNNSPRTPHSHLTHRFQVSRVTRYIRMAHLVSCAKQRERNSGYFAP